MTCACQRWRLQEASESDEEALEEEDEGAGTDDAAAGFRVERYEEGSDEEVSRQQQHGVWDWKGGAVGAVIMGVG